MDDPGREDSLTPPVRHVYVMLALYCGIFLVLLIVQLVSFSLPSRAETPSAPHPPSAFPAIFENPHLQGLEAFPRGGEGARHVFDVPPPPFSEDMFPCTECHDEGDEDVNPKPRVLDDPHETIVLEHGEKQSWCYTCHHTVERDHLRLADGTPVPYTESFRLCGQCHGTVYRDWKAGIHGRRMGMWDGHKRYLLCAHCHDPHSPRFKPLKPLPPPVRLEAMSGGGGGGREAKGSSGIDGETEKGAGGRK
ncbi:MAG: hypothetical protein ACYTHN_04605 [Planctomycetota bacterium]